MQEKTQYKKINLFFSKDKVTSDARQKAKSARHFIPAFSTRSTEIFSCRFPYFFSSLSPLSLSEVVLHFYGLLNMHAAFCIFVQRRKNTSQLSAFMWLSEHEICRHGDEDDEKEGADLWFFFFFMLLLFFFSISHPSLGICIINETIQVLANMSIEAEWK